MKECQFCRSLLIHQQCDKINDEHDMENGCEPLFHEITVALVHKSWMKGRKARAGRSTDYRYRGLGFELNFCPECGRKLKEGKA